MRAGDRLRGKKKTITAPARGWRGQGRPITHAWWKKTSGSGRRKDGGVRRGEGYRDDLSGVTQLSKMRRDGPGHAVREDREEELLTDPPMGIGATERSQKGEIVMNPLGQETPKSGERTPAPHLRPLTKLEEKVNCQNPLQGNRR